MHCTKTALNNVNLPPKACFVLDKAVHARFDGGAYEGHTVGGFMILDANATDIIWAG